MGRKERCPQAEALLQLQEGSLHGRRRRTCLEHVRDCPRCREELRAAERLSRLLAQVPASPASPELAGRILKALAEAEPLAPLTCHQARDLISPYLDNEVTPEQAERLWAHLFLCGPCLRRYREIERLAAIARRHAPVQVPAHLLPRVLAAVAQAAALPRRRPALRLAPAGLAALGSAAAVLAGLLLLRSPVPRSTAELQPSTRAAAPVFPVPLEPSARSTRAPATGQSQGRQPSLATAPAARRPASSAARMTALPPTSPVVPTPSTSPVRVVPAPAPAGAPASAPFVSLAEPRAVPAPAYVPPPPAQEPVALPGRPPSPAPAVVPPGTVAAAPTRPPTVPPAVVPVERESPPSRSLVVSSEPEAVRQLRWTPSQGAEVVVIRHTGRDGEAALAEVNEALNEYSRQLKRTQPRALVVVR